MGRLRLSNWKTFSAGRDFPPDPDVSLLSDAQTHHGRDSLRQLATRQLFEVRKALQQDTGGALIVQLGLFLIIYSSSLCLNRRVIRPASRHRLKLWECGGKRLVATPAFLRARAATVPPGVRDKATHLPNASDPSLLDRFSIPRIALEVEQNAGTLSQTSKIRIAPKRNVWFITETEVPKRLTAARWRSRPMRMRMRTCPRRQSLKLFYRLMRGWPRWKNRNKKIFPARLVTIYHIM